MYGVVGTLFTVFFWYVYVGDVNEASCIECPIYLIKPDIKAKTSNWVVFVVCVAPSPSSALCSNVYQRCLMSS